MTGPQHGRMNQRVGQALSVVFVLGFLVWLGVAARTSPDVARPSPARPDPGSLSAEGAPCSPPLRWYVAGVDPRFGVTQVWVEDVAREAAAVWGLWEGRPLLEEGGSQEDRGLPIRLVYDERQGRLEARVRREQALRQWDWTLSEESRALDRDLAARRAALQSATPAGASPVDTLAVRGEDLNVRVAALDSARAARDAAWDALARDFPTDRLEAAVFRVTEGSVSGVLHREIRVFTFTDRDELLWTLAHELGHALGVEHTDGRGGLMDGEQSRLEDLPLKPELSAADRRALELRCAPAGQSSGPR